MPKSINNTLTIIDYYDVLNFEKKRVNSIKVIIINGKIITCLTRDDMAFVLMRWRHVKKVSYTYHRDFDIAVANNLGLEYVKFLSTKDHLKYFSDLDILIQKYVSKYMKKFG